MGIRRTIYGIIEPQNKKTLSGVYDMMMLLAIIIGIFPLMFRTHIKLFWYFDLISGICFIVDYVLRWITADFTSKRSKGVAFLLYPFTPAILQPDCPVLQNCTSIAIPEGIACHQIHQIFRTTGNHTGCHSQTG